MSKLSEIVTRHVEACLKELRAAVEAEIAAAVSGLQAGVPAKARRLPQERAKVPRRAKSAAPGDRRGKSQAPRTSKARPCGCAGTGRHRKTCALAKPPRTVEQSPRVERAGTGTDSPRLKVPVDETRAARFARIEAAAAKRNGAAA